MPNSETIRRHVIEVSIGGKIIEAYPSKFTLATQAGFPSVDSTLVFPADFDNGKTGDKIIVSLLNDGKKDLYFSGFIYYTAPCGKYRQLLLTDSYKKLYAVSYTAAYRKEKASVILDDILEAAGISGKSITCPDVELARFSTPAIPAWLCIKLLIDALGGHGEEGLVFFFDEKDVFHFGTAEDTGKNEGEVFSFENGKNVLRSGSGYIEVLPRPVRHSRRITLNGKELVTVRTDLLVSRKLSRLKLFVKETT